MADWLKRPLNKSLNVTAMKRAADAIELLGKNLPCHVVEVVSSGIVTVAFDVDSAPFTIPPVTMPVQGSQWVKYPIQVGTKGIAQPSDVRLGYQSGLGGGLPVIHQAPANLSSLSFAFLGNTSWDAPIDVNALELSGPNGVVLHADGDSTNVVKVNSGGANVDVDKFGIFGTAPVAQETVIGLLSAVTDANAKAVLTSLITKLAAYGLIVNGTT